MASVSEATGKLSGKSATMHFKKLHEAFAPCNPGASDG